MKKFLSLLLGGLFLIMPAFVFAQEETPEVSDDTQYSYATVVQVTDKEIVVSEYDYEKDESINVTYALDPAIKLGNVNTLNEIKVDDAVEIIYTLKNDVKNAISIAVDKDTEEESVEDTEESVEEVSTEDEETESTPEDIE
jgi:hypothetical protein